MPDIATYREEALEDPHPRFPSDADLALAERLRRMIEERYLGHAAIPLSPPLTRQASR